MTKIARGLEMYALEMQQVEAVSIVVPTYNEAQNLQEFIERLTTALNGSLRYEIIIADDRSPDGTAAVAECLRERLSIPLSVVTRDGPRSLSLSVIEGAKAARYPCVVVLDSDLSHDPGAIPGLAREVLAGRCDVAIASRYALGAEIGAWPFRRRLLSLLGTRIARFITQVEDPLSGYFACRRELLVSDIDLHPRGYKILLELLGRAPGLRVVERPIRFANRYRGTSKLAFRQKFEFLVQIFSLIRTRFAGWLSRGIVAVSIRKDS